MGVLPVGAIHCSLVRFMLGATLQDLSLSLFVGILVGMFGTLFVSARCRDAPHRYEALRFVSTPRRLKRRLQGREGGRGV